MSFGSAKLESVKIIKITDKESGRSTQMFVVLHFKI